MTTKYHDILVAKQFETRQNGQLEHRTVWNKVGQAWSSKTPGTFNFELYLMPGQRYFINIRDEENQEPQTEDAPF